VADPFIVFKLALVPLAVWLASLAARKWGHSVAGYLGGMPLVGGPITLYLALDHGAEFAAKSALVTLAAIAGQAAHLIAFAYVGRRFGWAAGLIAGWSSFAAIGLLLAHLIFPPWVALAYGVAGLLVAWRLLPRARDDATLPAIPRVELTLRLVAAFALAAFILWGSAAFGPVVSGVLLSLPITGSIMPPFTLKLYGAVALARLLRGFITGLTGFTAFFFVVAIAVVPLGVAGGFTLAVGAALVTVALASHFGRRLAIGDD
jgi:hypothetical protein